MSNLEAKVNALVRMIRSDNAEDFAAAREELSRLMSDPALVQADTELKIKRVLLDIGVPEHLVGYPYLVSAIRLVVENPALSRGLTKTLYPKVAALHQTTPGRAERAIRGAIETGWERGSIEVLDGYFGNTINPARGKPTNGEFIVRIANVVRV